MRIVAPELITIAFFVLVGWAALWPLRNRVGAYWYHIAALPIGMFSAPLAASVSTVTKRPLDVISVLAGALLLIAATWLIARFVTAPSESDPVRVDARSFGIATGALAVLALVVGFSRLTVTNNDSFMGYWPIGVELARKGAFGVSLMGGRSPLITSVNAVHSTFGSDWAYVIYPMLAATVLAGVALALWRGPAARLEGRTRKLLVAGAVGFLVLEPSFLFHAFFVHSHMYSAVYFLLSVLCLWMAVPVGARPDGDAEKDVPNDAFLVLAGYFASGLALARPDGLAYMFVPVAVAISVLTVAKLRPRSVLSFFVPMIFSVGTPYAAAFVHLGLWQHAKLSGRMSLVILTVLVLSAVSPWILQALDRVLPFRVVGEKFLGLLVGVSAIGMVAILALKWHTARGALANEWLNIFMGRGGYFYLWYAVVLLFVLALFSGDALRLRSWTRSAFLAVSLFFVIAGLVHGLSHEGRIGVGDSFNRVAFQALPIIVWFVAAMVARILTSPGAELATEPAAEESSAP